MDSPTQTNVNDTNPLNASANHTPETNREDALIGYQTGISLWIYEGTLVWSKYNAMLVANSIILAIVGLGSSNLTTHRVPFVAGLSFAGLILCILWANMTKRGFDYYRYWILSVRELEETFLSPSVKTVSRGGLFADGQPVDLLLNGAIRSYRMTRAARLLKTAWSSYLVITVFAALYLFLPLFVLLL